MSAPLSDFYRFDLNFESDEARIGIEAMFRYENRASLLLILVMNWGFGESILIVSDDSSINDSEEVVSILLFFK